jgi:predicted Zn-dependent peptidase
MRHVVAAGLIVVGAAGARAELPMNVRTCAGDGGMLVHVVEMPQAPCVAVRLYLLGGAYAETGRRGAGIANAARMVLLERYCAALLDAPATSMPVRVGSRTDDDALCFWATTTPERLPETLRALARVTRTRTVDDATWRAVRERISRQLELREQDAPAMALQSLRRAAYAWHPARFPTYGEQAAFLTIEKADVERFLQSTVGAGAMVLVVAGDLTVAHVQAALAETFDTAPRTPVSTRDAYALTPCTAPRWVDDTAAIARDYGLVCYLTTLRGAHDEAALDVAAALLARRLPLLARRAWVAAGATTAEMRPVTLQRLTIPRAQNALAVMGEMPPRIAARAAQQLAREIEQAGATITDDDEVRAIVQQLQTRRMARSTQPARAARWVGDTALRAGNPAYALAYAAALAAVTRDDVLRVWAEYLCPVRRTTVMLAPEEGVKPAALAARENVTVAERQLVQATMYPVRRLTLDNGCVVLLRRTTAEPVVRVQFACVGGIWCETPVNNGVFTVLGRAMCRATTTHDCEDFARERTQAGVTLDAVVGPQTFALRATVLPGNLPAALALLCAAWRAPLVDKPTVNDITARLLRELQQQHTATRALADVVARDAVFARQAYRLNPLGSIASLNALTWGDVADIHNDFITPRGTVILISGAFDDQAVEQQLRRALRHFTEKKKSLYFATHQDLYRARSTPPYVVVTMPAEPAPTTTVTRVFAARRADTLLVTSMLAPARTASNAPPGLAAVACGAMLNAVDAVRLSWRNMNGLPVVQRASATRYSGYATGWLYVTTVLDATAGMAGARRVSIMLQDALRELGQGIGLSAAIARADLEHARRMSDVWNVLDELAWDQLFGQSAPPIGVWRSVTPEQCAAFAADVGAYYGTTVITPD